MGRIVKSVKLAAATGTLCAAAAAISPAQTYTTLGLFDGTDGANPVAALIQATNGEFYGTTVMGGNTEGTIFKISTSGKLKTVSVNCIFAGGPCNGDPFGSLVQAPNEDFYGTSLLGGAKNEGTVFKMSANGPPLEILYSFCSLSDCADGYNPTAGLVLADGNFYGITGQGGANDGGTVFEITPEGVLNTIYSFCAEAGCADGENPYGALVFSSGNFYGTTRYGGQYGSSTSGGTVFEITPSGTLTTLYSFCAQSSCADGSEPKGTLVQGANGDFYGTTLLGGTHNQGTVFQLKVSGASGTLKTLHDFCNKSNCTDGASPWAGVIQATDGDLYGTTSAGGANNDGTVFKLTTTGTHTLLYSFCAENGCADGGTPFAPLVQGTNGTFYGTAYYGGNSGSCCGYGVVYSLSVGLGPFVEPQTTSGKVGATVKILGTDLTGATSVTFNGTAATFTVSSAALITATVPSGATSGQIDVVTPSGTLSSNVPFTVLP
jgi:uncharacterized repeat protein (TIGR03803 family)